MNPHQTNFSLTRPFLWFVAAGCSFWAVGCGESSKTVPPEPFGIPAPGEFDQLELKINGQDALDGQLVLPADKPFKLNGKFHFVISNKERSDPIGSVGVLFQGMKDGKFAGSVGGADTLKFIGNRRATFSCDIAKPGKAGDYTLTVFSTNRKIIMQTKVRVEE